jgi:hypothetical protein
MVHFNLEMLCNLLNTSHIHGLVCGVGMFC